MIAVYHLYWIIPLCFFGGFFYGVLMKASKDGDGE